MSSKNPHTVFVTTGPTAGVAAPVAQQKSGILPCVVLGSNNRRLKNKCGAGKYDIVIFTARHERR